MCVPNHVKMAVFREDPRRILFIGNSYTGRNNLPEVFAEVVKSAGRKLPVVQSSTPSSQTLTRQLGIAKSMNLIDEGGWDVVVLQGHSKEPAKAENNEEIRKEFLESAAELCERIRTTSPSARICFYETWARHPDYWKEARKRSDVGANPREMQEWLRKWYAKAAEANHATFVPCGDAWELNYDSDKPVRLHQKDNSHPEFIGTYLNALILFEKIYDVKEAKISWHGKLTEEEAQLMQGYAAKILK